MLHSKPATRPSAAGVHVGGDSELMSRPISYRAEPGYLLSFDADGFLRGCVTGQTLDALSYRVLTGSSLEPFTDLIGTDVLRRESIARRELCTAIKETSTIEAPLRLFGAPTLIHIELTTRCPLRCPQCYAHQEEGMDFDKTLLFRFLEEAATLKVIHIALSGGEPLLYPHLTETIAYIRNLGMRSTMATSGLGLTPRNLRELMQAGTELEKQRVVDRHD